MTQDAVEGPGRRPGPSVLSRLVAVGAADFADRYWGRESLLSRAAELPHPFSDLLSDSAVDELLSERGLRTPFLRVAKAGSTLAEKAFTAPGGVGAGVADQVSDDKLVRLFAAGSTLVLQALHRTWPPLITFCQQLATELGHPVQANAYVTPPQNKGFSNHYDVHDVFVLQIEGEKKWVIHSPVLEAPLRDQPWTDHRAAVEQRAQEPPLLETVLRPGDCLYLPRGFLHAAEALGGVSTHITVGVHVWTRFALAEQLVQQALGSVAQDPAVRRSLPLGVSFDDPSGISADIAAVRKALSEVISELDAQALTATLHEQARKTSRAAPVGPLKQLRDSAALEPGSRVALRAHLEATLDHLGARVVLRSRGGDFDLVEDEVAPVKTLLASGAMSAGDLGLDLARRLMLAGLAVLE
ncbi:MAG TPA: cupin domain-containing protein [Propionibacteriaceae bacterium]